MIKRDEKPLKDVEEAEFEKHQLTQVFKNIMIAANQVSRKIQNMQARLKLLDHCEEFLTLFRLIRVAAFHCLGEDLTNIVEL